MKRLLTYLLFLVFGFFAGLLTYQFWPVSIPSSEISKPLAVCICELNRDPGRYDGKLLQVKAVLYGDRGGNPYLRDQSCDSSDASLSRMMDVAFESNQAFSPLPQWATYTSFCGDDAYASKVDGMAAEVILVGIYDSHQSQIIPRLVTQLSAASKRR